MAEKVLKDERLLKLLSARGITTQQQLRDFLNPSYSQLINPFKLLGVKEACEIINNALHENKKFVIVGDYDCDGIMAGTIMYQFFASKNADVEVFIPNRFDDGYGLNMTLVNEILNTAKPDVLITVDLGISCAQEIKFLTEHGVQVVVTDHHEPQSVIPDCVLIDPKIKQEYDCPYLCGTGVAYKLVSALAGFEFANIFLDVASIATIGDIVPLLGENRVIASLGLMKLNEKCFSLPSIKYLFESLQIANVSSSDIYLKIVPRINASGRMDNGKKVFDFINCSDPSTLKSLLADILADNALRLDEINKSIVEIEKQLEKIDIINTTIICVKGNFHQGVLGILASRILGKFGKPTLVFAKTELGTLKASGRSIESIDLHKIITKCKDLCIHFGGHTMAVGLELEEKNYDEFVQNITEQTATMLKGSDNLFVKKQEADIVISKTDISKEFISQLNLLAPFGCGNEKPTFKMVFDGPIKFGKLGLKTSSHLKLKLSNNANLVYFFGEAHKGLLSSKAKKEIFLDVDFNYYNNKVIPQGIVRGVKLLSPEIEPNFDMFLCSHTVIKIKSLKKGKNIKVSYFDNLESVSKNLDNSNFGTLVFASTKQEFTQLNNKFNNFIINDEPCANLQNAIVLNKSYITDLKSLQGYKTLIFLSELFDNEFAYFSNFKVYAPKSQKKDFSIKDIRKKCTAVYSLVKNGISEETSESVLDFCNKCSIMVNGIKPYEVAVCVYGLQEIGVLNIVEDGNFKVEVVKASQKKNLEDSSILNYFRSK